MKLHTSTRILSSCVAAALVALPAAPALAMQSDTFAEPSAESNAVVSVRTADDDPDTGVCTGTAIASHWVITARHCMDHLPQAGGSVRTGQGDNQKFYDVDKWMTTPKGDIALLHTSEDLGLDAYPEIASDIPAAGSDATFYGWSSDGSGAGRTLPYADATVDGPTPMILFDGTDGVEATMKGGAATQPGDSGGALFSEGKVAAIASASLFMDPDNPDSAEEGVSPKVAFAPVASQADWIREQISAKEDSAETTPTENDGGTPTWMLITAGAAVVIALVVAAVARSRKRDADTAQ